MDNNLQSYDPLVEALKEPLPERIQDVEKLRQMVAFAESYGIVVSLHRRNLLSELENKLAQSLTMLEAGWDYDDEGQYVQSEEHAERYKKLNADAKKILLDAQVSGTRAELDFVTNLENLVKRRCSLGQTISNSFNTEKSSAFNN